VHFDALIVGSGPAGVSCAWPLVESGMNVLMVDVGLVSSQESPKGNLSFTEQRYVDPEQWRTFLNLRADELPSSSPKLRAPGHAHVFSEFNDRYRIETEGFAANGSLAAGGLSNAWGAGAGSFGPEELRTWPLSEPDLVDSYAAVGTRIGISGSADDDLAAWFGGHHPLQAPLPMPPAIEGLYSRYLARRESTWNMQLGRPRQAVLTEPLGDRSPCDLSQYCLWGCPQQAIYNAAFELPRLAVHANFSYAPGWFVTDILSTDVGFGVRAVARSGTGTRDFAAKRVILAAGTIGSTKLALSFLEAWSVKRQLLTTPAMSFALLQPKRIGKLPPTRSFGLGHLAWKLDMPDQGSSTSVFGGLLTTDGMLPTELASRIPLLRPSARLLTTHLWSALIAGACFFPGAYTDNVLTIESTPQGATVRIKGAYTHDLWGAAKRARKGLAGYFRKLGAWFLPGSAQMVAPGMDMHYAGTLPMSRTPGPFETDLWGRLGGADGVHVVDASVLPTLPAKSHTFTMMANADRIGRAIAKQHASSTK
jgi:choline dehydrogenase-like flavoprotein